MVAFDFFPLRYCKTILNDGNSDDDDDDDDDDDRFFSFFRKDWCMTGLRGYWKLLLEILKEPHDKLLLLVIVRRENDLNEMELL